jgi:hypothetical protein
MVCPNCGTQLDPEAVFCSICGTRVAEPDAAAPQPPMPPFAPMPPGPQMPPGMAAPPFSRPTTIPGPVYPPQFGGPQYPPQPYGGPGPGMPGHGSPGYGGPGYGGPGFVGPGFRAPGFGGPGFNAPGFGAPYSTLGQTRQSSPIGGVLCLIGGIVTLVSAWLPWATAKGGLSSASAAAIDQTDMSVLASGGYLLIGSGILGLAGLMLLLAHSSPGMKSIAPLFGLAAMAGALLVVGVEVDAFNTINSAFGVANSIGVDLGISFGVGLFVGLVGGVLGGLGGLMGLLTRS